MLLRSEDLYDTPANDDVEYRDHVTELQEEINKYHCGLATTRSENQHLTTRLDNANRENERISFNLAKT